MLKRLDQANVVFGRVFQAGEVNNIGLRELVAGAEIGERCRCGGMKTPVVDAVPDHVDGGGWAVEKSLHVAGGGLADGREAAGLASEARHDVAAVSHARGIVFAAHVEGGAVVDRDHLSAGRPGEDAPVTGDVHHVGPDLPEAPRQDELVPEHVAHRRPPVFIDFFPTGAVKPRREQGAVFGESEEGQADVGAGVNQSVDEPEEVGGDTGFTALINTGADRHVIHARNQCTPVGSATVGRRWRERAGIASRQDASNKAQKLTPCSAVF